MKLWRYQARRVRGQQRGHAAHTWEGWGNVMQTWKRVHAEEKNEKTKEEKVHKR